MRWLQALYVANGLAIGALYGFAPVLLQARGFDPQLVGIATSLGAAGYSVALPAWGHIGDVVSGPRRALQLACIPAGLFALGLNLSAPPAVLIGCVVLYSAMGGPCAALTDAMAVPALADPSREYGRLRLLTSLGAGVGAIACGFVYSATGYVAAPVVYATAMGFTLLCAQLVPLGRDSERRRKAAARRSPAGEGVVSVGSPSHGRLGSVSTAMSGRPRLAAVLVAVLFVFVGVMSAATFMSIRISDLGGGPTEVGLSNGVASIAEVPGLILGGWLVSRFGLRWVLVTMSAGLAACLMSWIVLTDAAPILATRFISGIFFGGILVTFVLTIAGLLPWNLQSTGQTLFQATGFGLAAVIANLAGGTLYQTGGALALFGVAAACAAAGGVIGFFALPDERTVAAMPIPEVVPLVR